MTRLITPNRLLQSPSLRPLALVFALFFSLPLGDRAHAAPVPERTPFATQHRAPERRASVHDVMLKVWGEHVAWMRHYLISSAANLPDKDDVTVRLMRNQEDIGRAFTPYYGVAAGEKLTALLQDHVRIAADVIATAKAGDNARQNESAARWNKNADEIASFLHELNPKHWPLEEMQNLTRDHLQLMSDVIGARVHGQWADDVAMHDKVYRQMLILADTLSAGIANQFPEKTTERP